MVDISELLRKEAESEAARTQFLVKQISKGCNNCSQWDDYYGCNRCEDVVGDLTNEERKS